jgi:hypothetical protein
MTLPPFQLEGSTKTASMSISGSANAEEKKKLVTLTRSLISAIGDVDKVLADLADNLSKKDSGSPIGK